MNRYPMELWHEGKRIEVNGVSLFAPELGDVSISYQDRPLYEDETELVVYVDFDISKVTIVDGYGNDHKLGKGE